MVESLIWYSDILEECGKIDWRLSGVENSTYDTLIRILMKILNLVIL